MGYDFYITKNLAIEYENSDYKTVQLYREGRYFTPKNDSDSESDHESDLTVTYTPKILYENGQWRSLYIQNKYSSFLDNGVVKLYKYELRFLR